MQSQLHPPEILVYDLGNVLVDFDWMIVIKRLAQKTGKTISDFQQLLTNPKLLYDYEAGEITTQEFFNRVQNLIGYPNSLDDFRYDFGDMFTEAIQMTQLQKKIPKPLIMWGNAATQAYAMERVPESLFYV